MHVLADSTRLNAERKGPAPGGGRNRPREPAVRALPTGEQVRTRTHPENAVCTQRKDTAPGGVGHRGWKARSGSGGLVRGDGVLLWRGRGTGQRAPAEGLTFVLKAWWGMGGLD